MSRWEDEQGRPLSTVRGEPEEMPEEELETSPIPTTTPYPSSPPPSQGPSPSPSNSSLLKDLQFSVTANATVSLRLKNQLGHPNSNHLRMVRQVDDEPASENEIPLEPAPRFGHAACRYSTNKLLMVFVIRL